jgi:hypothetical protein
MTKKSILVSVLAFATAAVFGQNKMDSWPELKTFHGVMSQTFHPSEEGNLQPIKERAGEMLEKAIALQVSKPPAEFATDKIKASVGKLVGGAKELKMLIDTKQPDDVISKKLSALHDNFHEIVGLCMHGEGGEKHEEPKKEESKP